MKVTLKTSTMTLANLIDLQLDRWAEAQAHRPGFDRDQNLSYDPENMTVTYTGQRASFHRYGFVGVLGYAMTDLDPGIEGFPTAVFRAFREAEVLEYQTSDANLMWWEALEYRRAYEAPIYETMEEVLRRAKLCGWKSPHWAEIHFGPRLADIVRAANLGPDEARKRFDSLTVEYGRQLKAACTGIASW